MVMVMVSVSKSLGQTEAIRPFFLSDSADSFFSVDIAAISASFKTRASGKKK
jgi:hypothetical protein